MNPPVDSYRDLVVWQEGIQLALAVYKATESFPKHELYGLTSQIRRSAVSIPSNIAEGHARSSTLDYLRHLSIAMGSLAELATQAFLGGELGYSNSATIPELQDKADQLGERLRSLCRSLKIRADQAKKS